MLVDLPAQVVSAVDVRVLHERNWPEGGGRTDGGPARASRQGRARGASPTRPRPLKSPLRLLRLTIPLTRPSRRRPPRPCQLEQPPSLCLHPRIDHRGGRAGRRRQRTCVTSPPRSRDFLKEDEEWSRPRSGASAVGASSCCRSTRRCSRTMPPGESSFTALDAIERAATG